MGIREHRRSAAAVVVTAAVLMTGACSDNDGGGAKSATKATFTAAMDGKQVPMRPGDPDGSGKATIKVDLDTNEVCFDVTVSKVENVLAAHLQTGAKGQNGPIVAPLDEKGGSNEAWKDSRSEGCIKLDPVAVVDLLEHPTDHYVTVRTKEMPAGALRGQLEGKAVKVPADKKPKSPSRPGPAPGAPTTSTTSTTAK